MKKYIIECSLYEAATKLKGLKIRELVTCKDCVHSIPRPRKGVFGEPESLMEHRCDAHGGVPILCMSLTCDKCEGRK